MWTAGSIVEVSWTLQVSCGNKSLNLYGGCWPVYPSMKRLGRSSCLLIVYVGRADSNWNVLFITWKNQWVTIRRGFLRWSAFAGFLCVCSDITNIIVIDVFDERISIIACLCVYSDSFHVVYCQGYSLRTCHCWPCYMSTVVFSKRGIEKGCCVLPGQPRWRIFVPAVQTRCKSTDGRVLQSHVSARHFRIWNLIISTFHWFYGFNCSYGCVEIWNSGF